ncbi:MAG: InlB B-repeat-containing protein, partial [Clostridia bacterium]|nr:InlB B-repeat-containing protein [Clostridia bacterium]
QPAEEEQPAEAEQPAETQQPSPATEGSDSGEGGAAQSAVTEEVVSPEGIVAEEDQEQPAEPEQPTGEATEEEAAEGEPTAEGESTVEEQAQQPADESTEEETPIEEPVEAEGEAIQPVSVVFDAMPETAAVTVYPAATEEVPIPEAIPAQADGSFALLPGEYTYSAGAEGYASIENAPFTVTGDEQPLLLSFALEAQGSLPEGAVERSETEGVEPEPAAFEQSMTVNGVVVTVKAEPGVFPANAALSVKRVPVYRQRQADAAVEEVRDEDQNVAVSYTFDIKVINPDTGEEYQPAEGQTVNVSFALAEVADENLTTNVYHVTEEKGELTAEALDVTTEVTPETGEETTATVETDGFSIYQVEFTYNKLEYVLPGNTSVAMSEILSALGLSGEVTAVEVSDTSLFSASDESGEWVVTAHRAFSTTEWMKVTIGGVAYEITVTDDQETYTITIDMGGHGDNLTAEAAADTHLHEAVENAVWNQYGEQGPTAEGYQFQGFSLTQLGENPTGDQIGSAEGDYGGATVTGDTTVYAIWSKLYTVTINMQGHGGENRTVQAAGGASLESAAGRAFNWENPTADGYDFACFSTTSMADNPSEEAVRAAMEAIHNTVVSETNTTVYVVWRELCSVTINMQGHGTDQIVQIGKGLPLYTATIRAFNGQYPTAEGYEFAGYSLNEMADDPDPDAMHNAEEDFHSATVSGNTTVYVVWRSINYGITIPQIDNGTVTAKVGETENATTAHYGDTVTLTVAPAAGYALVDNSVTVTYSDGNGQAQTVAPTQDENDPAKYAFTMPAYDVTVSAAFKRIYTVTIAEGIEHGTVTADKTSVAEDAEDKTVTLTVEPAAGYALDSLTYTQDGSETPVTIENNTFTMPAGNVTVNAVFAKLYALNLPVGEPYGSVTAFVNGAEATEARSGETVSLVFTLNEGYQIQYAFPSPVTAFYTLDGTEKKKDAYSESGNTYTFTMPAADISSWRVLNGRSICTVWFDPDNEGTHSQNNVYYGDSVGCPDDPSKEGFRFLGWYQVLGESLADAPFDFEMSITGDITLRAKWEQLYAVVIDGNITGGTVSADKETAAEDETVTLTVEPATGYALDTLTVMQGETPVTVTNNQFTMPAGDVTVSATFRQVYAVTVHCYSLGATLSASVNGQAVALADPVDNETTLLAGEGETVTLTATPNDAYRIDSFNVYTTANGVFVDYTDADGDNGAKTVTFTMPDEAVNVHINITSNEIRSEAIYDGETVLFAATPDVNPAKAGTEITLTITKDDAVTLESLTLSYWDDAQGEVRRALEPVNGVCSFTMPNASVDILPVVRLTGRNYQIDRSGLPDGVKVAVVCARDEGYMSLVEATTANAGDTVRVYTNGATLEGFTVTGADEQPIQATKIEDWGDVYYTFTMPAQAVTLTGTAAYNIQLPNWLEHGSLSVAVNGTVQTPDENNKTVIAKPGDRITVTATPDEGYRLTRLSYYGNGGDTAYGKRGSVEAEGTPIESGVAFDMPDCDIRISAEFKTPWGLLQDEINSAGAGETIVLTEDVTAIADDRALNVGSTITLDLNGHTIDRNLSSAVDGGYVIYVSGNLTLKDSAGGGTITGGNNQYDGGGITVNGTLTMQGGTITGNNASNGGGVYMNSSDSVFNFTGGAITGNTSTDAGRSSAGVMYWAGALNVSGSPVASDAVWVENYNRPIHVSGALTDDAHIALAADSTGVALTQGLSGKGTAANFTSANSAYRVRVNASGEAELFAPTFYTVTCETDGNGGVTADMSSAAERDTVTLTATPAEGYALDTLTVKQGETDVTVENNQFTMPAGDVTVSATFVRVYTVSVSKNPYITQTFTVDGQAVTPIDGENNNMTLQIPAGAEVSVTATPVDSSEHRIEDIYIRNEDTHDHFGTVTDGENGARTGSFTMVEAAVNVHVNVVETGWQVGTGVPVYDGENVIFKVTATPHHGEAGTPITLTVEKAGDVTLDYMAYVSYDKEAGEEIITTLTPDADGKYTFTMPDSGVSVRPKYHLNRAHNIINQLGDGPSVCLVFKQDEYITYSVETTTANARDTVRVYPNGATLRDFKVNGTEVKVSGYESDPYYEFTMPDGNATLTGSVTYRLRTYGFGFAHGTVTVQVGDEVTDLSTVQSLSVPAGAQVTVTATPDAGYKLYRLSYRMDGQYAHSSDEKGDVEIQNGVPFTMPGGNIVIDAEFSTPWNHLRQQIDNARNGDTITLTEDAIAPAGEGYLSIWGKAITIDLNGHTIDRNLTAPTDYGCVISVDSSAALTLVDSTGGGKITGGNNNYSGGGIAVAGTLNLQGGKITGNSASDGGGVAVISSGAVFNLTGGEISGNANTSARSSAGVLYTSGTMNVSGSPVVTDAVYVDWNHKLHVADPLTNATPIPVIIYDGVSVPFTDGLSGNGGAANFKSASDDYRVRVNDAGEAELKTVYSVTVAEDIANGTVTADLTTAIEDDAVTLTATPAEGYAFSHFTVTDASGESVGVSPEGSFIMPDSNVTVTATFITAWKWLQNRMAEGWTITLEEDITCANQSEGPLVVPKGVTSTLDLNGHTVDRALAEKDAVEGGNVISVRGTLTVNDSSADRTGKITGGNNTISGGGVVLDGTFTLNGGAVTGNRTDSYAGGILNYGTFNMIGGAISDNRATNGSDGVYVAGGDGTSGEFTMTGGTISGN